MGANAVRAIVRGLGEMDAEPPPPFYSFDADIGRLSVSTRALLRRRSWPTTAARSPTAGSTSRGCSTPRACRSAASAAGRRPASASSCGARGRSRVLATQGAPAGAERRARALPARARDPHAALPERSRTRGRSRHLEAVGRVARGAGAVAVRHRFTPEYIESTWTVTRGRRRLLAEALFPSWGGAAARITAVLAGRRDARAAASGRGERRGGALLPPRRPARRLRPRARGRRPRERPPRRPPGRRAEARPDPRGRAARRDAAGADRARRHADRAEQVARLLGA